MRVIEVHPEELLDRELRGTLSERERQLLMAHLQRCSVCRLERQLRSDFERELQAPEQGMDLQLFVSGAIRAIEAPEPALAHAAGSAAQARAAGQPRVRRVAALLVACAVLSVGVGLAGAQFGLTERAWQLVREGVQATFQTKPARRRAARPQAQPAASHVTQATQPLAVLPAHVDAPAADSALPARGSAQPEQAGRLERAQPALRILPAHAAAPADASHARAAPGDASTLARANAHGGTASAALKAAAAKPTLPADAHARDGGKVARAAGASGGAQAPAQIARVAAEPSAAPSAVKTGLEPGGNARAAAEPSPALAESSAALFERANEARHRGYAIEASGLYRELQARFPHSVEARLSVAVVARMLLDRGENRAALSAFDAYLASADGALREEAMVGRTRALVRLGRAREAARAARELLDAYPRSAFAPTAQKLLEPSAP